MFTVIFIGEPSLSKSPVEFIEGESGSITCVNTGVINIYNNDMEVITCILPNAPCNLSTVNTTVHPNKPQWMKVYNASQTSNSVTINIAEVSRQRDGGTWSCKGFGDNAAVDTIEINVRVPVPNIIMENKDSYIYKVGEVTRVTCKTGVSIPTVSTINWFIGSIQQPSSIIKTTVNTDNTTTSILQYQPTRLDHTKTLTCSANNGYGETKTDSTVLNVQCKYNIVIINLFFS